MFLRPPANLTLPQRDLPAPHTGFASPQPQGEHPPYKTLLLLRATKWRGNPARETKHQGPIDVS